MKRKLNENLSASEIRLNVTLMKRDDPSADYNEMAHNIEMAGGVVSQDEDENGDMIMVINDVDAETVIDIVDMTLMDGYDDIYMIANSLSGMNYETEDMIDDIDYPEYDDVDEMDEFDYPEYDEIEDLDYPAYDEVDEDDFDEYDEYELSEKRKRCCPGRHINEKLKAFNDKDQKKLDGIEVSVKDIIKDLGTSTIGAHEAREAFKKLKAENAKLRKIQKSEEDKFNLNDVAGAKKAIAQIKKADPDNKEIEKFQKSLTEKVNNHLKLGKSYLHENVKFAGKSFKDMDVFEIKALYDKILAEKAKLSTSIKKSLNESDFNAIKLKLQTKNQLLDLLDEELTYRVVRQRCLKHINEGVALNEDGGEITDEELANLFGPAQGEEENTDKPADNEEKTSDGESNNDESNNDETNDDNTEEDEEVELSRIEITLKSKEAAEDLKQACLDADIPEDAMEIESDEDEDSEDGETEEGEESEEDNSEENTEENEESNDANESVYYDQIRKLLFEGEVPAEADNAEETPAEDANAEENAEETEDNTEDEGSEESEESGVKFVLTNTDYALQLAKVLEDQYGISKDKFQGMIGGEIIEEQSDESDESATEDGDDESKDSEGSEDSNDADVMDPSELFKGL